MGTSGKVLIGMLGTALCGSVALLVCTGRADNSVDKQVRDKTSFNAIPWKDGQTSGFIVAGRIWASTKLVGYQDTMQNGENAGGEKVELHCRKIYSDVAREAGNNMYFGFQPDVPLGEQFGRYSSYKMNCKPA